MFHIIFTQFDTSQCVIILVLVTFVSLCETNLPSPFQCNQFKCNWYLKIRTRISIYSVHCFLLWTFFLSIIIVIRRIIHITLWYWFITFLWLLKWRTILSKILSIIILLKGIKEKWKVGKFSLDQMYSLTLLFPFRMTSSNPFANRVDIDLKTAYRYVP